MSDFKFTHLDMDPARARTIGREEGRHVDTANHIGHFDLAGLNPEGTSRIDMKEFTVSHAVGNPLQTQDQRQTKHIGGSLTCSLSTLLGFEECISIRSVGELIPFQVSHCVEVVIEGRTISHAERGVKRMQLGSSKSYCSGI